MSEILLGGIVAVVTSSISSVLAWLLAKKKYNTEVTSNEIENVKSSLEFYENIVKDNTKKLQSYITSVENYRVEVYRLQGIINRLLNVSCKDNVCLKRLFFTEEEAREILGEVNLVDSDEIKD